MATGKFSRADGRRPSSYCSTVTIVLFVGVCLVGVWLLMSSSVDPQNSDVSAQEVRKEQEQKIPEKDSRQFEDASGDLREDAVKEEKKIETEEEEPQNESENDGGGKTEVESDSGESESNSEEKKSELDGGDSNSEDKESDKQSDDAPNENKTDSNEDEKSSDKEEIEEEEKKNLEENQDEKQEESSGEKKKDDQSVDEGGTDVYPAGAQSEILNETTTQNGAWSTQAAESENEKESQQSLLSKDQREYKWKICNVSAGSDYIPCLDNLKAIKKLHGRSHYEHRERHCPDEAPTCLVSLPQGYKIPIRWAKSREQVYFYISRFMQLINILFSRKVLYSGKYFW